MVGPLVILSSITLFLFLFLFLSVFIKFLHKVWWVPLQIQNTMRAQGIKGPSYKFLHGSTKEMAHMRKEALSRPMELSHDILPRILPLLSSWFNIYGNDVLYWFGYRAQLIVTEPECIKVILNNREKTYAKRKTDGYVKKLFGEGLVAIPEEDEKWGKLRKLANHAFHAEGLKNMVPSMIASVEMMLERWKEYEGKEIEVFEEFRLLTSEVISRTAFGSSYMQGKDIFEMLVKISVIISTNAFRIRVPGTSLIWKSNDDVESEKLEQRMRESIMGIIKEREKAANGEVESLGSDFLGMLVKAKHDGDKSNRITVEDIVDECKTFYVAGHETTTSLLSWTVLLLALYTDWQEKARKEVLALFGHENPTSDGIPRLKTVNMIINESLRLYPPVVALITNVKQETK